jgi:hypothetical protein
LHQSTPDGRTQSEAAQPCWSVATICSLVPSGAMNSRIIASKSIAKATPGSQPLAQHLAA